MSLLDQLELDLLRISAKLDEGGDEDDTDDDTEEDEPDEFDDS